MINEDVRHIVEAELQPGETLLWADKPAKFPFSGEAFFHTLLAFLLMIYAAVIFLSPSTNEDKQPLLFFGFIMSAGVYFFLLSGRDFLARGKKVYAITNKRGFVIDSFIFHKVITISPSSLLNLNKDGTKKATTLYFQNDRFNFIDRYVRSSERHRFLKVANIKTVETIIYNTFSQGHTP